jgi:hypothetical protein
MRSPTLPKPGLVLALLTAATLSQAQILPPAPPSHTNPPPSVGLLTPGEGEMFLLGHTIHLTAVSQSFTSAVPAVKFYAGADLLGVVTNRLMGSGGRSWLPVLSLFVWTNAPAGVHLLKAVATDLAGLSVTSAPVDITVVTGVPPVVSLVRPADGATILARTNLTLVAAAHDPDGTVARVEFFEGLTSLGVATNAPVIWLTNQGGVFPIRQSSYSLTWSNVPAGAYSLMAVATDNGGVSTTSAAVAITVVTDLPPVVEMTGPADGAHYYAPANITLSAAARDSDGTLAGVEFFAGSKSLGLVTNSIAVTNRDMAVLYFYHLVWTNVPAAAYTLTAVTTDNGGICTTSGPVTVTVVTPPPPAVRIIHPLNGQRFRAPANIYIASSTRYFTDSIASVKFLADKTTLGVLTNSSWPTYHWKNVPAGTYVLKTIATDTGGVTVTSPPVNIIVTTNRLRGPMSFR